MDTKRLSKVHSTGRQCVEETPEGRCLTILSKYNPSTMCYLHSPIKFPSFRGERQGMHKPTVDELRNVDLIVDHGVLVKDPAA